MNGVFMLRLVFLSFFLIANLLLTAGCETAKGVAVGIGATGMGIGKDAVNAWNAGKKADQWIKDNMW